MIDTNRLAVQYIILTVGTVCYILSLTCLPTSIKLIEIEISLDVVYRQILAASSKVLSFCSYTTNICNTLIWIFCCKHIFVVWFNQENKTQNLFYKG